MKRAIGGILLLVGMSVAPALAWDGNRGLHRDIHHDEARIAHDRYEMRRDYNPTATMLLRATSTAKSAASTATSIAIAAS
jgi:hypothetical protein